MVELTARTPCAELLPLRHGEVTLSAVDPGRITALMPLRGQEAALSEALQKAHGLAFPAPNRWQASGGARIVWTGRGQAFLCGAAPDASLAAHAALVDQGDGWAWVALEGAGVESVLARLVPVDLSARAFPEGSAARTLCQHMGVTVLRSGPERLEILGFRSMAQSLVHEIGTAMALVAARRAG